MVDDGSEDDSVTIIRKFPCRLVQLPHHAGASAARNAGAQKSRGEILFFIDADCLLMKDAVKQAVEALSAYDPETIIGGTYTKLPYDRSFYSVFQSVFINYSETKKLFNPDYIATHAMVIASGTFKKAGGFPEDFMPILEDVAFSHRLRRAGYTLVMNPDILVQHIFNFTFWKSMRNAVRKSKYWAQYSMGNKDLFVDSGTASVELKYNVLSFVVTACILMAGISTQSWTAALAAPLVIIGNSLVSRRLLRAFYDAQGFSFSLCASCYYMLVYPLAVGFGSVCGIYRHFKGNGP